MLVLVVGSLNYLRQNTGKVFSISSTRFTPYVRGGKCPFFEPKPQKSRRLLRLSRPALRHSPENLVWSTQLQSRPEPYWLGRTRTAGWQECRTWDTYIS